MSKTTNLNLFKHDNPSTNTDSFNIEKALNENWDKIDEEDGILKERLNILEDDNDINKQDINDINQEQTMQNIRLSDLEEDNVINKNDILSLKQRTTTNEGDILNIKSEQVTQNSNIQDLNNNKVDKIEGKELSTNDYDDVEKSKNEQNREDILLRALITETGNKIRLEINNSTYVLTAKLYDKNNNLIFTSNGIDLPIESMIVNATYDTSTKELVLTLQNGQTIRVSLSDIISGLQAEITSENKLLSDLVNDENQINKFVTQSQKNKLNGIESGAEVNVIETIKLDGTILENDNKSVNIDITGKEDKTNKVTELSNNSTDTEYPSAKAVYEENQLLKNDIDSIAIPLKSEGEYITQENTSNARFTKFEVGGNSKQKTRSGKNKLKLLIGSLTYRGVTITVNEDGLITLNGTVSDNYPIFKLTNGLDSANSIESGVNKWKDESIEELGKLSNFTLELIYIGGTASGGKLTAYEGETRKFWQSLESAIITQDNTQTSFIGVYLGPANTTFNNFQFYLQVEDGIKENISDYEPYGVMPSPEYSSEIKNVTGDINVNVCNKNLAWNGWARDFVKRINDYAKSNIEIKDKRNSLRLSAGAGYNEYDTKYLFKINWKPNTQYTIEFDLLNSTEILNGGTFACYYTDNTFTSFGLVNTANTWNKLSFTSELNKTIKYITSYYTSGSRYIDLDTFIVEEGTNIIDYEEHKEQTFIFPLAQNQKLMLGDYLADNGIHHKRNTVILNGTEIWNISQTLTNTIHFSISNFSEVARQCKIPTKDSIIAGLISNHFIEKSNLYGIDDTGIDLHQNGNLIVGIDKNILTTLDEFKAWLSNNNVTIEYDLIEEEIEPYSTEQQLVYNEIKKTIHSYKGQTNIYSTNETSPIFKVISKADTEAYIETINSRLELLEG